MMYNTQISNLGCYRLVKTLDSSSVDLVITDPPYESLEKHRKNWNNYSFKSKVNPLVINGLRSSLISVLKNC